MTRVRTIPELTEAGTRALVRELGYPDAVRFIAALRPGTGDYTKERRKLFKNLTLDETMRQIEAAQKSPRPARRGAARRKRSA